jgi:hypothetical protein
VVTLEKDKTMAETTNKKEGNPDAGKTTRVVKAAKASKAEISAAADVPEVAPEMPNLLEGFTTEEVAALVRTKEDVEKGRFSDITNEHRKLLFVKWLVEHHRLGN